eukprot:scaffold31318_cov28-Tisochrysis_lutea.AAC.4
MRGSCGRVLQVTRGAVDRQGDGLMLDEPGSCTAGGAGRGREKLDRGGGTRRSFSVGWQHLNVWLPC